MRRAARSVVLEARRVARDRRKKPPFRVKWLGGPIGRRATSLFIPVFMERPWRRSEGDCERMQIWNSFRSMPLTSRLGMLAEFDYPQTAVNVSRCGDMGIAVGGAVCPKRRKREGLRMYGYIRRTPVFPNSRKREPLRRYGYSGRA